MAQISMKLFVILAIFIPLASAELWVTGYADFQCTVQVSSISCGQAWNNCVGFGSWVNSFQVTSDNGDDSCQPPRGLWNILQLSFGCNGGDNGRGYGCGTNPSGCQLTVDCTDDASSCWNSPADAALCLETW